MKRIEMEKERIIREKKKQGVSVEEIENTIIGVMVRKEDNQDYIAEHIHEFTNNIPEQKILENIFGKNGLYLFIEFLQPSYL